MPGAHGPVAQHDARDDEGDRTDGEVHVEDPAPRGVVDQEAPDKWAGDARDPEHRTEVSLVAATFGRRYDVAHDRHGEHDQAAGSESLHGAERDQLVHVLAETGQDRAGEEDDDGELEDPLAPVEVGDLPVERGADRRGEEVGGHDPGQAVEGVEVADDGRQCRADDGLVERGQQHPEHQTGEHDEDLAVAHASARALGSPSASPRSALFSCHFAAFAPVGAEDTVGGRHLAGSSWASSRLSGLNAGECFIRDGGGVEHLHGRDELRELIV